MLFTATKSVRAEKHNNYCHIALPLQGGCFLLFPTPRATALTRLCPGLLCVGLSGRAREYPPLIAQNVQTPTAGETPALPGQTPALPGPALPGQAFAYSAASARLISIRKMRNAGINAAAIIIKSSRTAINTDPVNP